MNFKIALNPNLCDGTECGTTIESGARGTIASMKTEDGGSGSGRGRGHAWASHGRERGERG